jgi:hypothetical protein
MAKKAARKKVKKASKKKASRKKASRKKAAAKRTTTRKAFGAGKVGKKTARKASGRKTKKKARRTVMYSSAGKKLYAVRKADGTFKDIQSYQRAHAMDIARSSAAEEAQITG